MSKQEILKRLEAIASDASYQDKDDVRYSLKRLARQLEQEVWWEEVGPSGQHQESR